MAITTRRDMVDYLQALRDHAASARSRLPELFKGDTGIGEVAKRVEDAAAKGERLTVEQTNTFAYALRRAVDAYAYCFDIAYGFEVWTKNEIERLMAELDAEPERQIRGEELSGNESLGKPESAENQERPTHRKNNVVRLPLKARLLDTVGIDSAETVSQKDEGRDPAEVLLAQPLDDPELEAIHDQ